VFLVCAGIALFFGLCLTLSTYHHAYRMSTREVLVAVPFTWMCACAFGSLPFVFSDVRLSYTDALFETMSGLTATGSTLIIGLDNAPRGLLLWRFLLIWFGGFGVVTLALLVLPFLRIGGMQFFTMDLSAQSGKFVPRVLDLVTQIGAIYVGITVLGAIAYGFEGMTALDAIGHSMAAVATGGFSSHDAGIGFFKSPAIEWTATVQMLLAAMPFVLHRKALRRGPGALVRDSQVRLFSPSSASRSPRSLSGASSATAPPSPMAFAKRRSTSFPSSAPPASPPKISPSGAATRSCCCW
jgi:trk system potassium uptake protein TrkH